MPEFVSVEKLKEMVGEDNGISEWITVDQDMINKFADATGDHQWIHVDIEKAKQGPFGGPVAHGFLTLSLIPVFSATAKYLPQGITMAVNYGLNKVRFINPVPAGARVRSKQVISKVEEKPGNRVLMTVTHTIEIEGQDRPACLAEMLSMFFF